MQARKGRQKPTFSQVGEYNYSDGRQASELASVFWGDPLEWQRDFLDVMLARNANDTYRFHTVGASIPRQNGKSWDVRARCFYGLVASGEKILYTCQHGDTADEMFKALSAPFEDEDEIELHALLKSVRKTNGQQAIYLVNGGVVRFTTRTNSLARGRSYDVIIYDEAQELTAGQQAASLPTISASAKKNTQVIYLGTPPGPDVAGDVFKGIHDRVHDGAAKETAWIEWSADEIGDPTDKSRWYETNPSLGYLITEIAVQTECDSMAPDDFARERLGWWSKQAVADPAIKEAPWVACGTSEPPISGILSCAVKFNLDGNLGALAVCLRPPDGLPHVEVVDVRSAARGVTWFASWISDRAENIAQIEIDGKSKAYVLEKRLHEAGVSKRAVKVVSPNSYTSACSMFEEAVSDDRITHYNQPVLLECVRNCPRRAVDKAGGWGFDSAGGVESIPIEAAALAYHAAMATKRNPNRKMKIGW